MTIISALKTNTITLVIEPSSSGCTPQTCNQGYYWSSSECKCVKEECQPQTCPNGYYWDSSTCSCVKARLPF